ncbi:MAG: histidine phosphatase family protein [Pseudomonadota bacterium]
MKLKPLQTAAIACLGVLLLTACASRSPEHVIYLVRHGETVDAAGDRPLSPAGHARARWLADYFADRNLDAVYSTPLNRARQTAEPTADRERLDITSYNGRDLASLAQTLKSRGGRALVSGHSNTTPALANLLLGDERFSEFDHDEYSLILVLTGADDGYLVRVERSELQP